MQSEKSLWLKTLLMMLSLILTISIAACDYGDDGKDKVEEQTTIGGVDLTGIWKSTDAGDLLTVASDGWTDSFGTKYTITDEGEYTDTATSFLWYKRKFTTESCGSTAPHCPGAGTILYTLMRVDTDTVPDTLYIAIGKSAGEVLSTTYPESPLDDETKVVLTPYIKQ